jgi:hypothetical protein
MRAALWRETLAGPLRQQLHEARARVAQMILYAARAHKMISAFDEFNTLVSRP